MSLVSSIERLFHCFSSKVNQLEPRRSWRNIRDVPSRNS